MKIAIVGSREFCDKELVQNITYQLMQDGELTEFVSGGAKGVDSWAENEVGEFNNNLSPEARIGVIVFKPDWDKYGKRAGFLRNIDIVKNADMVIAFWDGKSRGTKHSIDLAVKQEKPTNIYVRS